MAARDYSHREQETEGHNKDSRLIQILLMFSTHKDLVSVIEKLIELYLCKRNKII